MKSGFDTLEKIKANDINFKSKTIVPEETEEERKARKIKEMEATLKNGDT